MTSQNDQIQALIAEIDDVLRKSSPRLPWVMSGDVMRQRRVLERVRNYLASVQPRSTDERPLLPKPRRAMLSGTRAPEPPLTAIPANFNQQLIQSVMQDLRIAVIQPLQADLEDLRQQREELLAQVRHLERQQTTASLSQEYASHQQATAELLQVLMDRLQERLSQQVSQTLAELASDRPPALPIVQLPPGEQPETLPLLNPQQRLEQLRSLQAQSDQIILSLDSSMRIVFDTLQSNLKSYHESLSQGIEKMHALGQQGEVMFSALIKRLAEDLGRETSSYLQTRPAQHPGASEGQAAISPSLPPAAVSTPQPSPVEELPIDSGVLEEEALELLDLTSEDWELNADEIDILLERDLPSEAFQNRISQDATTEEAPSPQKPSETEIDSAIQLLNFLNDTPSSSEADEKLTPESSAASVTPESAELQDIYEDLYDALFGSDELAPALDNTLEEQLGLTHPETPATPQPEEEPPSPTPTTSQEEIDSPPKLNETVDSEAKRHNVAEWVSRVENDLFGELAEPPPPEPQPEWKGEISLQAIERWLFSEEPVTERSAEKLAPRAIAAQQKSTLIESETHALDSETLANFVELFGEEDLEEEQQNALAEETGFSVEISGILSRELMTLTDESSEPLRRYGEDIFIPASPEESLLPTEQDALERATWSFWPDPSTLEQLQADLSSLEELGQPPTFPATTRLSSTSEAVELNSKHPEAEAFPQSLLNSKSVTLDALINDMGEMASDTTDDEFASAIDEQPSEELANNSAQEAIAFDEFALDKEQTPEEDAFTVDAFSQALEEPASEVKNERPEEAIAFDEFALAKEQTPEEDAFTVDAFSQALEEPDSEVKNERPEEAIAFDEFALDKEQTPEEDAFTVDAFSQALEEPDSEVKNERPEEAIAFDEFALDKEQTPEEDAFTVDAFSQALEEPASEVKNERPEEVVILEEITLDAFMDEMEADDPSAASGDEPLTTPFDVPSADPFLTGSLENPPQNNQPAQKPNSSPSLGDVDTQNLTIGNAFTNFLSESNPNDEPDNFESSMLEFLDTDLPTTEKKKRLDS
ncbi:MAG: hypothetical protein F6K32_17525 [Desertifilum sp. SIO1I2]|nr:hypothetical protein [Desertifilum sp. SIO1I2]